MTDTLPTIESILEKLILEIGFHVTRDYGSKSGLWEGMSIVNVRSRDEAKHQLEQLMARERIVDGNTSDGYHTFNELYEYRMQYNAALFNEWALQKKYKVHKSWRHADDTTEPIFGGGWFIVMAELPTGQISNHYPEKDWDKFQIPVTPVAHAWDGHTPQEALQRLAELQSKHQEGE